MVEEEQLATATAWFGWRCHWHRHAKAAGGDEATARGSGVWSSFPPAEGSVADAKYTTPHTIDYR